ncbi:hypothetical protein M885DRAFT_500216, partial [Pelagophyceae sp. CCMP2097]
MAENSGKESRYFTIVNKNAGVCTVFSADTIYVNSATAQTSLTLDQGQSLTVVTDLTAWYQFGGTFKYTDNIDGNSVIDGTLTVAGLITAQSGLAATLGQAITDGAFSVSSGAITGVTTMSMSGDLTMSNNVAAITHSGSTSLTVSSTGGFVAVEDVVFTGGAMTAAT